MNRPFPTRSETRYRFSGQTILPASLNADGRTIIGVLKDISRAGFRLIAREQPPSDWGEGSIVLGEFRINEQSFSGIGTVRHVKRAKSGIYFIGFKFDDRSMTDMEWCSALEVLLAQKGAGAIQPRDAKDFSLIKIIGTLSESLVEELQLAVEAGNTKIFDLIQCIDSDEVGLNMLANMRTKGIVMRNANGILLSKMQNAKIL